MSTTTSSTSTIANSIPIETIARIFKELSFKNKDTRITLNTLESSSEYIKLFINEAILRSNEIRIEEEEDNKPSILMDPQRSEQKSQFPKMETFDELNDDFPETEDGEEEEEEEEEEEINESVVEDQTQQDKNSSIMKSKSDDLDSRHLNKIAGILVLDF
ncbi:unnamed protein product [Candida verbasci]|uniref:Uncharacterized protein n=1 Tax=Candida verbasci TaxID=1227364 RepID=A0A9W4X8N4_9ASCO|nr:unnamed protein product [Candida verbasci]